MRYYLKQETATVGNGWKWVNTAYFNSRAEMEVKLASLPKRSYHRCACGVAEGVGR